MSLHKTYRSQCDGLQLAARLNVVSAVGHINLAPWSSTESSTKARRLAIASGWGRIAKTFPIFADKPDAGSTTIKYDLCPACWAHFTDK
jgi:hypothetical protein